MAFLPDRPEVTLAKVISERGETQLHVSETEKYPHVTYFFNGGEEEPYPGEVRELVDSPRDVPTYDYKPEMSARESTDAFVRHWEQDRPVFGIINFANADMVGHTGVIEAAVKGIETVDECLGRVIEAVRAGGGAVSSPRTTATRTRCSRRTGRPTPPTRSTRCRSWSRSKARGSTARASSPTSRRPRSRSWASSSRPR